MWSGFDEAKSWGAVTGRELRGAWYGVHVLRKKPQVVEQ